jgi:hypothetical protein
VSNVSVFEAELSGGHPNSLGNTVAVVQKVVANEGLVDELVATYGSADEVVRLRVSSALKRVCREQPGWIYARLSAIESWVATIEQPSAQWTLAQMYSLLSDRLTPSEKHRAIVVVQGFLETSTDWIVLNFSMQTLADWANDDPKLGQWLIPVLQKLEGDPRKSVATRAKKLLQTLS